MLKNLAAGVPLSDMDRSWASNILNLVIAHSPICIFRGLFVSLDFVGNFPECLGELKVSYQKRGYAPSTKKVIDQYFQKIRDLLEKVSSLSVTLRRIHH